MYSTAGEGDKLLLTSSQPCRCFSLADIQSATKDFDDELVIGQGGFGKVYKGHIFVEETSLVVAIKRLDSMSDQGAPEFRAEIEMLSKLRHCHLVSLIGYCDENKEMILVYEYMPNGTLHDHLHKTDIPFNWVQRLKIAIGAARGLDYLHTGVGTQHGIIHRDVKSSNILLDGNWAAMISDFGLSRIGPTNQPSSFVTASVKGTFGYLDPEYFLTRRLTRKTDVFAFGVVLFELLSGRLAVDERFGEEQCSLVRWAQKCVKERRLDQLVDPNIKGTIFHKCLRRFAQVADRCLHSHLKERPAMAEVVFSLQLSLEQQEKYEKSAELSGKMGFTWKINKYLVSPTQRNSGNLKLFTYDELKRATRGFGDRECLGEGFYGKVYKGWVDKLTYSPSKHGTGLPVAVKRLHHYRYESPEMFELDLKLLRTFSHPNLVKLIGYCLENELFLVYEFMHNGKFEDYLGSGAVARLPLVLRMKMAIAIARGLVFARETQDKIISSQARKDILLPSRFARCNILLDEDFTAKLSDFDVMILVPGVGEYDNCLYEQPYPRPRNLTCFTEVFEEIITGKPIPERKDLQDDGIIEESWGFTNFNDVDPESRILETSFTGVLETITGISIPERKDLQDDGILEESWGSLAKLGFEICNDVDPESRMLQALKSFYKDIPT